MSAVRKIIKTSTKMNQELDREWDHVNTDIWVMYYFLNLILHE